MAVAFVNPPPPGALGDFSQDPEYEYGTPVGVKWTGSAASLTLWQLQPGSTTTFGPSEYLIDATKTENSSDVSSYTNFNWQVQTSKNLSLSNHFILSLFDSGQSIALCSSHYFDIIGKSSAAANLTSSSTTSSIASSTQTTLSVSSFVTLPSTPVSGVSFSSATSAQTPSPGLLGLSDGAKVGIGVGIPAAILFGVALGWFCFSHRRKQGGRFPVSPGWFVYNRESPAKVEELPGSGGGEELPGSIPPQYELAERCVSIEDPGDNPTTYDSVTIDNHQAGPPIELYMLVTK